jgi:predicted nucleic acid-binding protein
MFIDTNVLVHAASPDAPDRERARVALANVAKESDGLCISRQILREFVAVITRPQMWSKAKSPAEAAMAALKLAADFEILEDGAAVWDEFVGLCRRFSFGGRQVHDANIVATMLAHGERRLLTFKGADFRRFDEVIEVVSP